MDDADVAALQPAMGMSMAKAMSTATAEIVAMAAALALPLPWPNLSAYAILTHGLYILHRVGSICARTLRYPVRNIGIHNFPVIGDRARLLEMGIQKIYAHFLSRGHLNTCELEFRIP